MAYSLDGYVDVAERIRQLREKHPQAVLRPWNPDEPFKIMMIGNREFIVYTAACYRTPDDPMPAVAVAAEPAVGKTNYTRDSEVMNAETSAWGRCIVACLAADTQKVASLNEVVNRRADDGDAGAPPIRKPEAATPARAQVGSKVAPRKEASGTEPMVTDQQRTLLAKLMKERNLSGFTWINATLGKEVTEITQVTKTEASRLISALLEQAKGGQ
jgi:hypothetical protein